MKTTIAALLLATLTAGAAPPQQTNDALPALRDGRWHEALPILETVVAANPFDGRARYYLGVTYQRIDRNREAIDELRSALELGVTGNRRGMRSTHVALARSLIVIGNADSALAHLEEAWAHWGFDGLADILSDEDFSPLHEDPRLQELAGLDPRADTGDREARWRADLRYLRRLIAVAHREPFHSLGATSWNATADELDQNVGQLSDRKIVAEFMRLTASIDDGHTAVYPPTEGDVAWHLLPFFPVRFKDGWFIAAAAPEYAELVGAKIVKAAGRDWPEIVNFAAEHLARDNTFTQRWLAGVGLQFAELYTLASGSADATQVEFVVEQADGIRVRKTLVAEAITRNPNSHWAPEEWTTAYEAAPLWLRDPTVFFHHEMLLDSGVVYARILQMADGEEQSLADYGRKLREFFIESDARALILDLRLNNGGDANEARGLVDELIRIPGLEKSGSLAVLIGPRSYSATGYLLGMMEKHLAPVFVGWPSGCRPVGYSSERRFQLPYSGLSGSISYELRVDGNGTDDLRPAFFPHHLVWPSGEDLRQSSDPVIETALQALRSGTD
jgi:tetratricopeptide (TPR) repeat protein